MSSAIRPAISQIGGAFVQRGHSAMTYRYSRISSLKPRLQRYRLGNGRGTLVQQRPFSVTIATMSSNNATKAEEKTDAESKIKRNPHPDFKQVEGSRPDWPHDREWTYTKTVNPEWKFGDGPNDGGACLKKNHVEIDPYEEGRPAVSNYKLLISAVVPRPICFMSTRSKDGTSTNLAPFSWFNEINHDPPMFIVSFAGGFSKTKDSLKNLSETGECCINIISEHFVEAANACSIDSPFGVSEWALSGLHPAECRNVKASRVKEAVFAVECKLVEVREYNSHVSGKPSCAMAVVEGTRFWVREDAINADKNIIDPNVLRPMARLGGIMYSRLLDGMEILRPSYEKETADDKLKDVIQPKAEGQ